MSDETPRDAGGQFTSPAVESFGLAGNEAEAGYKPMPQPTSEAPQEFESADEAYDALEKQEQSDPTPIIYHDLETGQPADEKETVTLERAAADLASYESQVVDHRASSISSDFAAEIDALRAEATQGDPELAKEFGIEPPEAEKSELAKVAAERPAVTETGQIDPVLAQQIENHPQVREFIASKTAESQQAREAYSAGLNNADAMLRATFMNEIPELSGLDPSQFQQGLALLQQVDPVKFNKAVGLLSSFNRVQQAQQQHHQYQAQQQRHQFVANVQAEDARLVEMVGAKAANEANQALVDYLGEHGVPREQMTPLIAQNPVLQSAEARKTIMEAAKYRAMVTAAKPRPSHSIPPVQRPGHTAPKTGTNTDARLIALNRQLDSATSETAQLKIARQIVALTG